ncbi:MAG: protein kinase [Deltaproteobacteria bacterium]|nr:protein kinase [Deltaproteobacteria bacterium]
MPSIMAPAIPGRRPGSERTRATAEPEIDGPSAPTRKPRRASRTRWYSAARLSDMAMHCPHCGAQHEKSVLRCPATGLPVAGDPTLVGGTIGGRYRLVRLLGDGGMGSVYKAEDNVLRRFVAIKMLHRTIAANPSSVERFEREARASAAIGHPNIIDIIDFGRAENGSPFMVMEYLRGRSLASAIAMEGPFNPERACRIAGHTLAGLHAAHLRNILHRDLKPANLMLIARFGERDFVKVCDFGFAALLRKDGVDERTLTPARTLVGTPAYAAPERLRGDDRRDPRIDVYSMGVVLYEMLTGVRPFDAPTFPELLRKVRDEMPTPLRVRRADLDAELAAIVERALAKNAEERWGSAEAFANALGKFGAKMIDPDWDVASDSMTMDLASIRARETKRRTLPPAVRQAIDNVLAQHNQNAAKPAVPEKKAGATAQPDRRAAPEPARDAKDRAGDRRAVAAPKPGAPVRPADPAARRADPNQETRVGRRPRPTGSGSTPRSDNDRALAPTPLATQQPEVSPDRKPTAREIPAARDGLPPGAGAQRAGVAARGARDVAREPAREARPAIDPRLEKAALAPPPLPHVPVPMPDTPLPVGGEVVPSCHGAMVVSALRHVARRFGERALAEVLASLPDPEAARVFQAGISEAQWVGADAVWSFLDWADRKLGSEDLHMVVDMGRAMAEGVFDVIRLMHASAVEPEILIAEVGPLWAKLRRGGSTLVPRRVGKGFGRLELVETGEPSLIEAVATLGFLERALGRFGARDVEVTLLTARALGDETTMYDLTWLAG